MFAIEMYKQQVEMYNLREIEREREREREAREIWEYAKGNKISCGRDIEDGSLSRP